MISSEKVGHEKNCHMDDHLTRYLAGAREVEGNLKVLLSLGLPLKGKEAEINSARDLSNISAPAHYYLIEGS